MRLHFIVVLGLLAFSPYHALAESEEIQTPLTMEIYLNHVPIDVYVLDFFITNTRETPYEVDLFSLPWRRLDTNLEMKIEKNDKDRTALHHLINMVHYKVEIIKIEPGETRRGQLRLHHEYPTLLRDIHTDGVTLEWRCHVQYLMVRCPQGKGMSYIIQKGGHSEVVVDIEGSEIK